MAAWQGRQTAMPEEQVQQAFLIQESTTYPSVTNLERRRTAEKVNRAIRDTAAAAIPDYNPGTSIIEAQSGYTTQVNMKGVLSLRFQDYFYPEKAAHGATKVSSVTLDLESGDVYGFDSLFRRGSNYRNRLSQLIQTQINARKIPLLKPFGGVGRVENYYLTPNSLIIYYQPYEYTPGAVGVLEFAIPFSQIRDIVNPEGPIGKIIF